MALAGVAPLVERQVHMVELWAFPKLHVATLPLAFPFGLGIGVGLARHQGIDLLL